MPRLVSVVVPVFNEQDTIRELHRQLMEAAQQYDLQLQTVFVDDGSTDDSWSHIVAVAQQDARTAGLRFRRNFGKAAALSAGFAAAEGDVIAMMDADLQDVPAELPKLLAAVDDGCDVATGWKRTRHDPWHKRWPSKVFNSTVSWLTGVRLHDHNCGFKCMRREVSEEILLYGERHRFIPVLAAARGFRVAEVAVQHRPRLHGRSKYGWERIPKGLLDVLTIYFITSFARRPQHWLGSAGLTALLAGGGLMAWLAAMWVWSRLPGGAPIHLHQSALLYYSLTLTLLGGQLLATGFVAEMIASSTADQSEYPIAERIELRRERDAHVVAEAA